MKKQLIVLSIAAMTSGAVLAAGAPVANQFSAGQPARAAEVNANFQELGDRIDTSNTNVSTNTSGIATNATGVTTNAAAVSTNATGISTNATGISTNATGISTNATGISTNATGVSTNATGVSTNATGVSTNATGVSTNATGVSTNATGVSTNATGVSTNATGVSTNADGIAANAVGVSDNATGITSNIAEIDTNIADIATNATDIATISSDMPSIENLNVNESLVSRKFVDQNPDHSDGCNVRDDSFVFDTSAKTFVMDSTFSKSSDQTTCYEVESDWSYSGSLKGSGYTMVYNGSTYVSEYSMASALLLEHFAIGDSWGDYYDITLNVNSGGASSQNPKFDKKTAIGYQNIVTPADSFQDCLVVHRERWSGGSVSNNELYFYCSGAGLSRIVDLIGGADWQLESITQ